MQSPTSPSRLCVLVMGPSGVGKSTFAQALAEAMGASFIEGDDYHTSENRAAMSAGRPLTDEMRQPWLIALADTVRHSRGKRDTVFTCSALKRRYRDLLREGIGEMRLLCLSAPRALIRQRMIARKHFMPAELLDSQIEALEAPTPDEYAIMLEMSEGLDANVARALKLIGR
ncbi:gluconokinase [Paracoccus saliphilus]|uniref:Gluconokinase n=1 Tax=Paracoccus saliphilus TaxID=405559 RepID=A0AA45W5L9_9RHOB|nr:gluconokinase [Paracoccus saliphilus]WCR02378.1 gluconokinase [Paracoccus saliphilus]SIS94465.1 gluconate kinase, SKI family [Paracoccus saliphilus]